MPTFAEYMAAVFGEIALVAGQSEILPKFRTADLPEEIRPEQFAKLRSLKVYGGPPEPLIGGGFIFRQRQDTDIILTVSVENLTAVEIEELDSLVAVNGGDAEDLDPAAFCSLAYQAVGHYRIRSSLRSNEAAQDVLLNFSGFDSYTGHDVFDVMGWFEAVRRYRFPPSAMMSQARSSYVAAVISAGHPAFRSKLLPEDIVAQLSTLAQMSNINPENIYTALTASHWKHAFLEVYRLVEAVYYLPWIMSLRSATSQNVPGLKLAQHCRDELAWREREKPSIRKIFDMVPSGTVTRPELIGSPLFADVKEEDRTAGVVAERVYRIRNQLVHQEDYEEKEVIVVPASLWPTIISMLTDVLISVYGVHAADVDYSFLVEGSERAALFA